jgi:hypothetical protein
VKIFEPLNKPDKLNLVDCLCEFDTANGSEPANRFVETNGTEFVKKNEFVGIGVEVTVASIVGVTVAAAVGMGDGEGSGDDDRVGESDGEGTPEQPKVTITKMAHEAVREV